MITKILTAATIGLQTKLIEVETDLSPSLPAVIMVGLPDKAVQESKERIRSAIKESGFEFPIGKLTINLAPADISKVGTGFDLPIAVGILQLMGYITTPRDDFKIEQKPKEPKSDSTTVDVFGPSLVEIIDKPKSEASTFDKTLFLGELSLDGQLRGIPGILSVCIWARQQGYKRIFVPISNIVEARLINNLEIFGVESLGQLVRHLNGHTLILQTASLDWSEVVKPTLSLDAANKDRLIQVFQVDNLGKVLGL